MGEAGDESGTRVEVEPAAAQAGPGSTETFAPVATTTPGDPEASAVDASAGGLSPVAGSGGPDRPKDIAEYADWAKTALSEELSERVRTLYEVNATSIQGTAQSHQFFDELPECLNKAAQAYRDLNGADLLLQGSSLNLEKKSFQSIVEKCFRRNVLLNKKFPSPPKPPGWVTSQNWTSKVNDIVRGVLVCRYLDGPDFLAKELKARAKELGLDARSYSQQQENGHYAFHFYVKIPVEILDLAFSTTVVNVDIEIQLTTQLQDVLRDLTHKSYEKLRLASPSFDAAWKWEFSTNRFKASYLSHTLHLLEGLIVELRRETHGEKPEDDK
jgi:ppGpp synthetase/RelA/SpoT-type nucleotidyltranferase